MKFALGVATLFVLLTIGSGVFFLIKGKYTDEETLKKKIAKSARLFAFVVVLCVVFMISDGVMAEGEGVNQSAAGLGFLAAGLSTGLAEGIAIYGLIISIMILGRI